MKIHTTKIAEIQHPKQTQKRASDVQNKAAADTQEIASIELSRQGILVNKVNEVIRAQQADPMREAHIEELKAAIENGSFHVDADEVSLKILRDALKGLIG